jgi:hypothetical protein
MASEDTRKLLRIQDEVLAPWRAIAEREHRSLTKQVEYELELARQQRDLEAVA